MVTPLRQCVARPDTDGQRHWLVDHLVNVAIGMGDPNGSIGQRLGFLAGLLHDAGKCHEDWQRYIDPTTLLRKGPPHAPIGAALFCYVATVMIRHWCTSRNERRSARNEMLNWILAVQSHHGALADFSATTLPWMGIGSKYRVSGLVPGCDLDGVFHLVRDYYPPFAGDVGGFCRWLEDCDRDWLELVENDRKLFADKGEHHKIAMTFPRDLARLIVADRTDAGQLPDDDLDPQEARLALSALAEYCQQEGTRAIADGAAEELVGLRRSIQDATARNYAALANRAFYTLLLPTGYGKTLTALRIALEACAAATCRRIIYVAPYISILSQAAKEIAEASGLRVFEHHHLSLAKMAGQRGEKTNGDELSSEFLKDSDDDFEVLDTWKVPIVATTFNQFFRALFPKRAQHALRVGAVQRAFIIIDEPQIIDVAVWNVFLRALKVFAAQHDCQIIFATATLPPLEVGLQTEVAAIAPGVPALHRYDIEYEPADLSLRDLTTRVQTTIDASPNVAVVLNTVRDAYLVFDAARESLDPGIRVYCLTGMMLPGHKQHTIREIHEHLKRQREGNTNQKLVVVCTQILEAGVNLSFRAILRARSIFPSIAQVAGRANRHNEGQPAKVYVFPFKADGEKELRPYVYRDKTAIRMTDRVFEETPQIPETLVVSRLQKYYEDCWEENSQSALLKCFHNAALGQWSSLANLEPFGFSAQQDEIFVPAALAMVADDSLALIQRFAPQGPEQLIERYLDRDFQRQLDFREKKLFSLALRQFVVPTRRDVAERIADQVNDWLWRIRDASHYSTETGLAHWLERDREAPVNTTFVI